MQSGLPRSGVRSVRQLLFDAVFTFSLFSILAIATTDHEGRSPINPAKTYHYVIVGAGPAGFVLAEHLSRDENKTVLLLEAGSDGSEAENIYTPGFAGLNEFSNYTWDYYTTPQSSLAGRTPHLAQGKLYGGGTAVNYMNYNRGAKSVFDEWANISGVDALSWHNLFDVFREQTELSQNSAPSTFSQQIDHNAYGKGPLTVSRSPNLDGFDPHFYEAMRQVLQLPQVDFNSGAGIGLSYGVETIRPVNRTREDALTAYGYQMAHRHNVHVRHGAFVQKVNIKDKRAESLVYTDLNNGNSTQTVNANEIILSAGAIQSPKILMLSGVGPAVHLKSMGIPVILNQSHIGSNLRDHNYGSIEVEVVPEVYTLSRWTNASYLAEIKCEFKQNATGPLARAPASSFGILRVPDAELPEGSAGAFHRSLPQDRGQLQMQYANVALLANTSAPTTPVMTIWVALTQAEASGTLRLTSANPFAFPAIDTAYFASSGDKACVLYGYKKLREVLQSSPLKQVIVKEIYPGPLATTDEQLWAAIQGGAQSYHHPMGTVALGTVLDTNFRIKGLQGLRVVDASVVPTPTNVHLQDAIYAVAKVAASLIAEADG